MAIPISRYLFPFHYGGLAPAITNADEATSVTVLTDGDAVCGPFTHKLRHMLNIYWIGFTAR